MDVNESLEQIARHVVNVDKVRRFRKNRRFLEMAFGLFHEGTQLAMMISATMRKEHWEIDEAVIGGNTIRIAKLGKAVLQTAHDHQAELFWPVSRMFVESVINLRYLVEHGNRELFEQYRHDSLLHELELEARIKRNIEERGETLPIEVRMLRSIELAFRKSDAQIESITKKKENKWRNLNLRQKACALQMEDLYEAIYGAPSRNVHGGWYDLVQHHLDWNEDHGFTPRLTSVSVRPQVLFVMLKFMLYALHDHLVFFSLLPWPQCQSRLQELEERNTLGEQLHEEFLIKRQTRPNRG